MSQLDWNDTEKTIQWTHTNETWFIFNNKEINIAYTSFSMADFHSFAVSRWNGYIVQKLITSFH